MRISFRPIQINRLKLSGITARVKKISNREGEGFRENLGLARAANIRELLMDRGIAENRVFLDYQLIQGDTLAEPLTFLLFDEEIRPDEYASSQYIFTNMAFSDANFEVDKAEFNPGPQLIDYADSVATYIALFPEKKLTIIGHTDSDGSLEYNEDLGLRRAKSARAYFKNDLGFKPDIKVETKGKTEPVAPNDTPENKQKNRRVNFQIN